MNLSLIESCVELIELGAFATKEDIAKALKSSIKLTKEQAKPLADELKKLKEFVRPILVHGDDCVGNWDGFELQELAVKSGCFIEVERTEFCNLGNEERVRCVCREYHYGDQSWTCYQTAKFLLEDV